MKWRWRKSRVEQIAESAQALYRNNHRCPYCKLPFLTLESKREHEKTCSERPSDASDWRH